MQDACKAFVDDHTGVELRSEVYKLAQLGGNHRGNASRALRRIAQRITVPLMDTVMVPLFDARAKPVGCETLRPQAIINPDDFMHWCFEQHRSAFGLHVLGGRSARDIVAFWKSMHREDCAWRNSKLGELLDEELATCIPMQTYGDGVPVDWITMRSMLALGFLDEEEGDIDGGGGEGEEEEGGPHHTAVDPITPPSTSSHRRRPHHTPRPHGPHHTAVGLTADELIMGTNGATKLEGGVDEHGRQGWWYHPITYERRLDLRLV